MHVAKRWASEYISLQGVPFIHWARLCSSAPLSLSLSPTVGTSEFGADANSASPAPTAARFPLLRARIHPIAPFLSCRDRSCAQYAARISLATRLSAPCQRPGRRPGR